MDQKSPVGEQELKIAILIATYNRRDLALRTIESILKAKIPPTLRCIVIAENGSNSGLEKKIIEIESPVPLIYRYLPRAGKSNALNDVIKSYLEEEWLLHFLDDDFLLHENSLLELEDAAKRWPKKAFFGGRTSVDYEAEPDAWLKPYLPWSATGFSLPYSRATAVSKQTFLGGNWAAYRNDLIAAGYFSESYGPEKEAVGEETLMQKRLHELGIEGVYVPGLHGIHFVPKQNCTPEWAIQRVRRHGIFEGRRTKLSNQANLHFFKLILKNAWYIVFYLFALLTANAQKKFHARFHLSRLRGISLGLMGRDP